MKKNFILPIAGIVLCLGACASGGHVQRLEDATEANQRKLAATGKRVGNLEQNVAELNQQMAQLNNRVYEVRTNSGRKTGMKVVAVAPPAPKAMPVAAGQAVPVAHGQTVPAAQGQQPATGPLFANPALAGNGQQPQPLMQQQAQARPVQGRPVQPLPAGKPVTPRQVDATPQQTAAMPQARANLQNVPPVARVEKPGKGQSGAKGSLGGQAQPVTPPSAGPASVPNPGADEFALPPSDMPATPVASPAPASRPIQAATPAKTAANDIPALPPTDLALPPEHPALPPAQPNDQASRPQAAGQQPVASAPAAAPRQAPARPAKLAPAARGEEAAYRSALNTVRSGRTAEGIGMFQQFLQQYPGGRYAANAEYWIGEGLYAQGRYQDALNQFQAVNSSYPTHHKNADALLKAGMCLSKLGDRQGAGEKFRTILSQFPRSEAAAAVRSRGLAR